MVTLFPNHSLKKYMHSGVLTKVLIGLPCVRLLCLNVSMLCTAYMHGPLEGQKRASDPCN